jgi:hypothetical protein
LSIPHLLRYRKMTDLRVHVKTVDRKAIELASKIERRSVYRVEVQLTLRSQEKVR